MSEEMKEDNGVIMAGQDSSDTSDDEELKDPVAEQEESAHTAEDQDNVELPTEANLNYNQEASTERPPEPAIDGDINGDENEPEISENDGGDEGDEGAQEDHLEDAEPSEGVPEKLEDGNEEELKNEENVESVLEMPKENGMKVEALSKKEMSVEEYPVNREGSNQSFLAEIQMTEGDESGTEDEQVAFMKELENFFKENSLEFKPPKFYGEGLNCLKLWRAVTRLGGYDQVTSCKLWRQVGESFKPPKTCTTVSWSFRCFYEKALLEYERHKTRGGELRIPVPALAEPPSAEHQSGNQPSGSGRARRDAAARAMQGWHSQRLLGNGEVGDPIIKDKTPVSVPKRDKHFKSVGGTPKRKKPFSLDRDRAVKAARTITKAAKPQVDTVVADIGPSADWVKINVRKTKDCFEVYALVPGLLREEVRVQSDPAGRLVISGDPEQPDNPWGVTPFKKVVTLPSRIDPHQTSAVVTLHGQLFVRVPFEPSDS